MSASEDTDGDGISNVDEENVYGTDLYISDTDADGINDGDELAYWGENWNQDYDVDGLINLLDPDSDNDGVLDGEEIVLGTDPGDVDEDDDGMRDEWETGNGLNPLVNDAYEDPDGDLYFNLREYQGEADPNNSASIPMAATIPPVSG
jgi:hypothetical protein